MITHRGEVVIPVGGRFKTYYEFESAIGVAEDFSGRTATLTIKNISEDFEDENEFEVPNAVEVEPLDEDSNVRKGRLEIDIAPEYTNQIKIPESESDPYIASGRYAVITIRFDNDEVPLLLTVRPVKAF